VKLVSLISVLCLSSVLAIAAPTEKIDSISFSDSNLFSNGLCVQDDSVYVLAHADNVEKMHSEIREYSFGQKVRSVVLPMTWVYGCSAGSDGKILVVGNFYKLNNETFEYTIGMRAVTIDPENTVKIVLDTDYSPKGGFTAFNGVLRTSTSETGTLDIAYGNYHIGDGHRECSIYLSRDHLQTFEKISFSSYFKDLKKECVRGWSVAKTLTNRLIATFSARDGAAKRSTVMFYSDDFAKTWNLLTLSASMSEGFQPFSQMKVTTEGSLGITTYFFDENGLEQSNLNVSTDNGNTWTTDAISLQDFGPLDASFKGLDTFGKDFYLSGYGHAPSTNTPVNFLIKVSNSNSLELLSVDHGEGSLGAFSHGLAIDQNNGEAYFSVMQPFTEGFQPVTVRRMGLWQ
jgi:hypothetical protein